MYESPRYIKFTKEAVIPTKNLAPKPVQPFQPHCHTIRAITGKCPHGHILSCISCLQSTLDNIVNRVEDGKIVWKDDV